MCSEGAREDTAEGNQADGESRAHMQPEKLGPVILGTIARMDTSWSKSVLEWCRDSK